jgi:uncharacterized BrkB/YihY/UPF0761 family membrane protein
MKGNMVRLLLIALTAFVYTFAFFSAGILSWKLSDKISTWCESKKIPWAFGIVGFIPMITILITLLAWVYGLR